MNNVLQFKLDAMHMGGGFIWPLSMVNSHYIDYTDYSEHYGAIAL